MAKKNLLGIEFGSSRLKIAEVKGDKVVRFVKEDMPERIIQNGEIIAWDALQEFLGEVFKKNKFTSKNVALVVPDTMTYTRRLSVPLMTEKQLKVNLPYEFHDFIAEGKENYIYDFAVVNVLQDENETDTAGYRVIPYPTLMYFSWIRDRIRVLKIQDGSGPGNNPGG